MIANIARKGAASDAVPSYSFSEGENDS
jgi:hypothetical protein